MVEWQRWRRGVGLKIAYVLHRDAYLPDGVARKVNEQVRLWREAGHEVLVFTLSGRSNGKGPAFDGPIYGLPEVSGLLARALRLPRQAPTVSRLLRDVDGFHPDVIYLRYLRYMVPIHRLGGMSSGYVVELQSLKEESRLYGRMSHYYDILTRSLILGSADGFVCVSHEIARQFEVHGKRMAVIANGVNVDDYEQLPPPQNRRPSLVFIGASWSSWQGLDKVLSLARRAKGLTFDVVGGSPGTLPTNDVPDNVTLHGYLSYREYRPILARSDLALGTLALHRKGMTEASPLKVREYLAHGIPTVIAYRDTDLEDADYPFVLKMPNSETNVADHAQQIIEFAHDMVGRRADREAVRGLIDSRPKERRRLRFLEKAQAVGQS